MQIVNTLYFQQIGECSFQTNVASLIKSDYKSLLRLANLHYELNSLKSKFNFSSFQAAGHVSVEVHLSWIRFTTLLRQRIPWKIFQSPNLLLSTFMHTRETWQPFWEKQQFSTAELKALETKLFRGSDTRILIFLLPEGRNIFFCANFIKGKLVQGIIGLNFRYTYTSDQRFRAIHKVMSEDYLLQILPVKVSYANKILHFFDSDILWHII